jgi:glucuronate isomerase
MSASIMEVLATTDSPARLAGRSPRRSANRDGRRGLCPPSGPIRWSIRSLPDFASRTQAGRADRRRHLHLAGYLNALRKARAALQALGCTSTDHGHLTAQTADLPAGRGRRALFNKVLTGKADATAGALPAQMLTEMAQMSLEDGLVMQIHPGKHAQPQPQGL